MAMNSTAWRRWLGALCLAAALLMLVGGETLLQGRLRPAGFLLYWLGCFALTGLAICIAFLDAWAVRRRTRQEERELLRRTFTQVDPSTPSRESSPPPAGRPPQP